MLCQVSPRGKKGRNEKALPPLLWATSLIPESAARVKALILRLGNPLRPNERCYIGAEQDGNFSASNTWIMRGGPADRPRGGSGAKEHCRIIPPPASTGMHKFNLPIMHRNMSQFSTRMFSYFSYSIPFSFAFIFDGQIPDVLPTKNPPPPEPTLFRFFPPSGALLPLLPGAAAGLAGVLQCTVWEGGSGRALWPEL